MKTIRCVIIDDEQTGINALLWELENITIPVEVVATYTSALDAIFDLDYLSFDILFLDIEMPKLNGLELLKNLKRIHFDVIFVTAYDQYALNAYNLDVIDYLLKPVHGDRLLKALNKHILYRKNNLLNNKIDILSESFQQDERFEKLPVSVREGIEFIPICTIIRLESDANYTTIFTAKEKYVISKPLKEVERQLEGFPFYRIHRSHTINLNFISKYIRGRVNKLVMEDQAILPISPEKKEELKNILKL